jgi:hypothetical protein
MTFYGTRLMLVFLIIYAFIPNHGALDGGWMVPAYGNLRFDHGATIIGGGCPFTDCSTPMPVKKIPYRTRIEGDVMDLDLGGLSMALGNGRNNENRPSRLHLRRLDRCTWITRDGHPRPMYSLDSKCPKPPSLDIALSSLVRYSKIELTRSEDCVAQKEWYYSTGSTYPMTFPMIDVTGRRYVIQQRELNEWHVEQCEKAHAWINPRYDRIVALRSVEIRPRSPTKSATPPRIPMHQRVIPPWE